MCLMKAVTNANTPLGYKFAFYRNVCGVQIESNEDVHRCINIIKKRSKLPADKLHVVHNLCTLIDSKSENVFIEGFDSSEIDDMITHIAES